MHIYLQIHVKYTSVSWSNLDSLDTHAMIAIEYISKETIFIYGANYVNKISSIDIVMGGYMHVVC